MSEEILAALMQLFAIIAKQDEGVEANEIEYVHTFLTQQLNAEAVNEYMGLFNKHAGLVEDNDDPKKEGKKKIKLTSVKDSVRTLGICRKINKKLTQKQKVVALVRLFELVNADRKFSEQRMAIINTVAEVFKVTKEEFTSIESFVIKNTPEDLDDNAILIINDTELQYNQCKKIQSETLDGAIFILRIKDVDLYFLKYTGTQDVFLNGLGVNNKRIYLFASGSALKLPKGKPIYYSDVAANFLQDSTTTKLSFNVHNLSYRFPNGELGLRNINFSEEHGKLMGIMGASGAGKTTLLNVLCGINTPSDGSVLINGYNLHTEKDKIEGVIGYIPQDDLLIEELTVFQNLYFSAKQCFKDKEEDEIVELVNKTLKSLGLFERKDLKVGSPLNKMISGGQRKRLNIALELIREPSILFVDEPTSGLSSRDSENVMDLLSELTLKGKLIFVVIHQPSSDIYKMFDKMIILDTGGYMIYYGNPVEAVIYFKKADNQINSAYGECQTCGNVNPELIFNILESQVVDEFGQYTGQRKIAPKKWEEVYHDNTKVEFIEDVEDAPPSTLNIPSWFNQFKIYTFRDVLSKISNTQYIALNLLEAPLLGFILSFIIRYIADPNSSIYIFRDNENIPAYIFMSIVVALFIGLTVSAEEIFRDRKILKREAFLNLSKSSYLMSKVLILSVISALQALLYVIVGNSILGVSGNFLHYWFLMFTVFVNANMMGLNISATFNSAVTIYILIPLVLIPQMALGGAFFSFDKLNRTIGSIGKVPLIAELMPARWAYEGIIVHQFKNNEFERIFFDYEKYQSEADFKQVHLLPKLDEKLVDVEKNIDDVSDLDALKIAENSLKLLSNEISKELYILKNKKSRFESEVSMFSEKSKKRSRIDKQLEILIPILEEDYSFIDKLNVDDFTEEIAEEVRLFINSTDKYYSKVFLMYDDEIEYIKNYMDEKYPGLYIQKEDKFQNEHISDIVKKVFEKNKIIEYDNHLIQQVDPIYLEPDNSNYFNFRSHFLAPQKQFMGKYYETFWFNMIILWLITLVFYIGLYFDFLKGIMNFIGNVKIFKKLGKS